jgi:hypothetical protein
MKIAMPQRAHLGIVDEPALHHPPADRALREAQSEDESETLRERAIDPAPPQEPDQRQYEHEADGAAEQAVAILPPEDALESVERHVAVHQPELRSGAIAREGVFPLRGVERRDGAHEGLPLDNRETGVGEPGDPPHHDHRDQQRATRQHPDGDGTRVQTCPPRRQRGGVEQRRIHGSSPRVSMA